MKKLVILGMLAGCLASLYGQNIAVIDSIVKNIDKQLLFFPHEKIYLHTDKPYYITGEKIFFRAFLLDALSNKAAEKSRYIYVELINPADSVVKRIKIRPDDDKLFYGTIPLPEELPQGNYKIRAYTQYMRNQGESSFFSKYVQISDPQRLSIQTQSDFQFSGDGKINTSLQFINAKTKEVIHPQLITLRLNHNPAFTGKPDKEGWIRVRLNVPEKAAKRVLYVELVEDNRLYRQYIRIPYPDGDFDVSFYPEGGYLIAGQPSVVAFKALHNSGKSLDIKGEVADSKGNTITEFKTFHDGMGEFLIHPLPGERYQAVCRNGDRTFRFDLPEVQTNTSALKTFIRDNKLWVSVNRYDSISNPELFLLIHSGGLIIYAEAWDASKEFIAFDASIFPSGINHIVLLTNDLQVISERMVFLLNGDNGIAAFQTQKKVYGKRELIQAAIQLKSETDHPLKGSFSIAVTNDREVIADTTSGIMSGILLCAELKGHIENPEYYFQKGNKDAETAADLLMKTHGWTRYAIPEVVRGKLSYPDIPFETGQEISGTVKSGLLLKTAKKFEVSLFAPNTGFFDQVETDENGRYVFWNFEFPDSTVYTLQALNSQGKGQQLTNLYVDENRFPEIHPVWIEPAVPEATENPVWMDYVAKADLHYTYENGMRVINLPEVLVKGTRQDKNKYKSVFYSEPENSFSAEEIEEYAGSDIINLLSRIPGVIMDETNGILIRGVAKPSPFLPTPPPLIVIDDVVMRPHAEDETVLDILRLIDIHNIGQLDVLKSPAKTMMYDPGATGGAIVIYTKKGERGTPQPLLNIKTVMPLGYQSPIEFYSPIYDSQESRNNPKPDLRTTIYWKPNVVTDGEGNVKLDFYTADDTAAYSVIIEGVSDDGKLIHYRSNGLIKVK